MPCFLRDLPDDLLRYILHEWMHNTKPDLRALDIACCNHEVRRNYLQSLSGATFGTGRRKPSMCQAQWMTTRGVSFSYMVMDESSLKSLTDSPGLWLPEKVSDLSLQTDNELAASAFLRRCCAVNCLEIACPSTEFQLWMHLPAPQKLWMLQITIPALPPSIATFINSLYRLDCLYLTTRTSHSTVVSLANSLPLLRSLIIYLNEPANDLEGEGFADLSPPSAWDSCPSLDHIVELEVRVKHRVDLPLLLYLLHRCTALQSVSFEQHSSVGEQALSEQDSMFLERSLVQRLRTVTKLSLTMIMFHPNPSALSSAMFGVLPLKKLFLGWCTVQPSSLLFQALSQCHQLESVEVRDIGQLDPVAIRSSYQLLYALDLSSVKTFTMESDRRSAEVMGRGVLCPILIKLSSVDVLSLHYIPLCHFESADYETVFQSYISTVKTLVISADHFYCKNEPFPRNALHFALHCAPNLTDIRLANMSLSDAKFVQLMRRHAGTARTIVLRSVSGLKWTTIDRSVWQEIAALVSVRQSAFSLVLYDNMGINLDALDVAVGEMGKQVEVKFFYSNSMDLEHYKKERVHAIAEKYPWVLVRHHDELSPKDLRAVWLLC